MRLIVGREFHKQGSLKVEMISFVSAGGNDELVYTDSLCRDTLLCKIFEMGVNGSTFCLLVFSAIKRLHKVSMVMKVLW